MNIDYLNRVGTAYHNFKTHEMRLNEENQNLKKEILEEDGTNENKIKKL